MSRYFAVLRSFRSKRSYVIAEVVREADDDGSPQDSLASQLIGREGRIMTDEQLESSEDGRRALRLWHAGNDDAFDRETLREEEPEEPSNDETEAVEHGTHRHLRSVGGSD